MATIEKIQKDGIGRKGWFVFFGGLILFFLLLVSQTVRSTQLLYKLDALQEDIQKEEEKRNSLAIERDKILSMETLETTARNQLGLVVPKEENIIVIPLPDGPP